MSVDEDNYFKLYSYCDIVCKATIQCCACIRIGFFFTFVLSLLITFQQPLQLLLNTSTAFGMLVTLLNLYHIFWKILWFILNKKCEYGPIYHLLLSIKGNSFYYVPGNCKDCLTDVQTHIQ